MTAGPQDIVILGLSLSSSWGNGHATTFRALLKGLHRLGHRVLFLERDVPWYAANRDLADPDFCDLALYTGIPDLLSRFGERIRRADAVIVGSYVPEGVAVLDAVLETARGTVAFYDIDTPVTLAKLGRCDEEYLERRQIPLVDLYLSFAGGPTLDRLESEFGARRAAALFCSVDETLYRPLNEPPRWDLGYLGTFSSDRQPTLERLLIEPARRLPHRRFVVAGPQYPDSIDWPANVERIDHLPPAAHAAFYSRQRWTLNVTRADMIASGWSPSVRLFEAAACRTPIVSDAWPGLDEIFPPQEAIVVATDPADVVRLLETAGAESGRAVADAARRRVLAHHTGTARARDLLAALRLATPEARPAAAAVRVGAL
ncbi:CgeB family protein [Chthonobacter albigriseus]|uniref:CgeB family protein n=1 Tax=Chthonobacter albigriseus TaxID=1683161 RepID=UPI0015EEB2EA|nr:glycosyltransferase [Chthonobacter albigriseus]